jgi:hypothetical protein
VCIETTLRCDQCGADFIAKTSWARFCSQRCRNAWWRHQYKLAEVQFEERKLNGHGSAVSGTAIVEAIKSAVAPAVVAENAMRRRVL